MTLPIYRDIDGLEGREPVGAVLTIGKKGPSGAPVETDRFFFVSPYEVNGVRSPLPDFKKFNEAKPELRQTIHANLVHATIDEAWLHYLNAHKLPSPHPNPPSRRACCTGDGVRATRFAGMDGERELWKEIPCPHRLCEYRQGKKPACGAFGRLYFRPRWEGGGLPTPLVKWTNHSWNTTSNVIGFFEHVCAQARSLGLGSWSVYGLPFTLRLEHKTQPQHQRAFPVVSVTPHDELLGFVAMQRKRLADAGGRLALAAGNTTPEETTPEALTADYRAITPGVPGDVIDGETELVAGADREQQEREAVLASIDGELAKKRGEMAQRMAMQAAFGVGGKLLVRQLSLDALTEGLAKLRAQA